MYVVTGCVHLRGLDSVCLSLCFFSLPGRLMALIVSFSHGTEPFVTTNLADDLRETSYHRLPSYSSKQTLMDGPGDVMIDCAKPHSPFVTSEVGLSTTCHGISVGRFRIVPVWQTHIKPNLATVNVIILSNQ